LEIELTSDGGSLEQGGFFTSLVPGTFNITAQASGIKETITINVLERDVPVGDDDDSSSSSSKGSNWPLFFIPALIIILVTAIIVVLLVLRSKGGKEDEEDMVEGEDTENGESLDDESDDIKENDQADENDPPPPILDGDVPTGSLDEDFNSDKEIIWDEDGPDTDPEESTDYLW